MLEIGSHARSGTPRHAVGFANVLFLAVPWEEVKDALSAAGVMNGKTLISCVNPFGPRGLEVGLNTSAAEEISRLVPDAAVVEAFNTIFATILHSRAHLFGSNMPTVFYCGDRSRRKEPCRRTYPGCRPSAGRRRRSGKCPVRPAPCDADDGTRPIPPNFQCDIDELIDDGIRVAVRWTGSGTHTGNLLGIAPTNRKIEFTETHLLRISGGRRCES